MGPGGRALRLMAGRPPHHPTVSPEGGPVWVRNHASGDLVVSNVASRRPGAGLAVAANPQHVAAAPDGTRPCVVRDAAGMVVEVEPASRPILDRTLVGRRPRGVTVLPR